MNFTTALPSRRFRGDRFQMSIPPRSPISFPPSLETGNITTPSDHRYQGGCELTSTASITVRSCHSCPPFHAPTFSNFAYPASENQACLPPIALDSQMGPALQLFSLSLPAALAPPRIYPVSPSCWRRWVFWFFSRARQSCGKRDMSSAALRFPVLPKYL